MMAVSLEAHFEKEKTVVPILGKTGRGNKAIGWKGTGSATFHYNTSIFRKMMERYKNTGVDLYFDIQIANEAPTSDAGRQTVILKDCSIDSLPVSRQRRWTKPVWQAAPNIVRSVVRRLL